MQQPAETLSNHTTLSEVISNKNTGKLLCPKCSSIIVRTYYEPQCLQCGYVDYSTPLEKIESPGSTVVGSATRYMVRYKGHSENFKEKLAHVKVVREKNRIIFNVNCPFCETSMEQTSLSGKRKDLREERFKCNQGHRVSLLPSKKSGITWR
mgnify:CR=1 FL=1|tara:strand:- start:46 stop:501 length:456 start_codon:yes stop_codon:yes gene_type:complete